MRKLVFLFVVGMISFSCDTKKVHDEYKSTPEVWHKDDEVSFTFQAPDTIHPYNVFINLRNNNAYKFSNIFLIAEMNFPNHSKVTDTLEYEMAKANGEWLGTGFSDVKENKLWYKEQVRFPITGDCEIKISHAMRKNGNELGVETLEGILDVGFRIEKTK